LVSPFILLIRRFLTRSAYLPALKRLKEKYTLVAVYSRSISSASALAKVAAELLSVPDSSLTLYHDQGGSSANLNALLTSTSIDAVIVILPITLQPEIVLAALRAGKHVLSEKPVAADVSSGYSLITEYQAKYAPKGLHWRIAENFECEPAFMKAAEAIRAGRIGKISHWRLRHASVIETDNQYYKTPWRTVPDHQGGFVVRQSFDFNL
jgi:predicted dehydrogenase